jgi:hypothetical protein
MELRRSLQNSNFGTMLLNLMLMVLWDEKERPATIKIFSINVKNTATGLPVPTLEFMYQNRSKL